MARYRFRALLHNMVLNPAERQRPPGVDELAWREALGECAAAGADAALWPVLASGFGELCARYGEQTRALAAQSDALERAARELAARSERRDAEIVARAERLRLVHAAQAHRLLRAARAAEAADARNAPWDPEPLRRAWPSTRRRCAVALACCAALFGRCADASRAAAPFTRCAAEEAALRARLARLQAELAAGGGALSRRVDALHAAARARAPQPQPGADGAAAGAPHVEPDSLAQLSSVLAAQSNALRTLADVLKRDLRDVAILEHAAAEGAGGAGGAEAMRM